MSAGADRRVHGLGKLGAESYVVGTDVAAGVLGVDAEGTLARLLLVLGFGVYPGEAHELLDALGVRDEDGEPDHR